MQDPDNVFIAVRDVLNGYSNQTTSPRTALPLIDFRKKWHVTRDDLLRWRCW